MPRIVWSVPSRDDLRSIDAWLTRETTPAFAVRTLSTIRIRARFLEDFPKGGRPHRNGTRILRVLDTPYLLRYRIRDEVIEVLRVYHERQDWTVDP